MSSNLDFLLVRLLHFNNFLDGITDVDVLAVFLEHVGFKLAIRKHVFNAELQLVAHVNEILVDLQDAIFKIINVLISTLIHSRSIKLDDEVLADSFDDARLVHDRA